MSTGRSAGRRDRTTVVLVHGGFLGAWIRTYVVAALEAEGIPMQTLDLPSVQTDAGGEAGDLYADARAVRRRLAELDPEQAAAALFHACDPAHAQAAVDRLRPMSMAGAVQPLTGAAWRALPATLVRGTLDRMPEAIAPAFFDHEPEVDEIPAGHCPSWSRPELVAEILTGRARELDRSGSRP